MKKAILAGSMVILIMVTALALGCAPKAAPAPAPSPAPSPAPAPAPEPKDVNLFYGSTTSTSGAYVWSVAVARVVNKYAPGITITVVESGATYDNLRKIREGIFHGGLAEGWNGHLEMHRGLDTFEGDAWDGSRIGIFRNVSASRTFVRADSDIQTWSDLAGGRISSGMPGSSASERVRRSIELLGVDVEQVPMSLGDAARELGTGRLDAVHKSGPIGTYDAALMAIHQTTPLRIIGFSDEETAILNERYPQFLLTKTPAGVIKPYPGQNPPLWEIYTIAVSSSSKNLPQETGYQIMKAVYEHWDEIKAAFPASTDDTIKDYMAVVPKGSEIPWNAGVVQYAKEIGIDVPDGFIPPEYKP